ncbi:MAG: peptidoglycan DD-metalloendopeptidase family protein [Rhodobacteraceae bacterium]|nr:peptidoglycan DD-metalloendopeptidase family protein [Paracoccaceae bacterium]
MARNLPEQRLFLRSDTETRFVRLSPKTQLIALSGSALVLGWTIIASAILLMDTLGAGNYREQAEREQRLYEQRLNALAAERDTRAEEAHQAYLRFAIALDEVSAMQSRLLASEERRKELETGIGVMQATLSRTMQDRDGAREEITRLAALLADSEASEAPELARIDEMSDTLDFLVAALSGAAAERDEIAERVQGSDSVIAELELDRKLLEERNDRIFHQLEEAVAVSLEPLDDMFREAGLPADSIIETIRRGYSGQGGPLTPITFSTKGEPPSPEQMRANTILERLDALNLYRIAVQKTPFAEPVKGAFRYTSGYGKRRDPKTGGTRMHKGADFAGSRGTPIYSTADGVVVHASRSSGYGNLIKIKHEFGIETRYAHLSKIRVTVGQRVSRGERIGDMGNTGRSTGTHLHYEVRIGGNAVNPMTYIKAARDVF